jgi:hypothetical protein
MSRRPTVALLGAMIMVSTVTAQAVASNRPSTQESANPINDQGSSYHYRTYVTSITPKAPGLSVEVLEFADRLLLRNHTGQTVTIYGYSGEPYARMLPDGAAEQNVRSPAVYLNTNFYASVTVPPSASASAPARWEAVARTGQFEWHDHRIHWMSPVTPPQVKDKSRRTKIFSWSVPIRIGTQSGAINGELFWVPEASKAPAGAIVALAAIVVTGVLLGVIMRRRRRQRVPRLPGADNAGDASERREAW